MLLKTVSPLGHQVQLIFLSRHSNLAPSPIKRATKKLKIHKKFLHPPQDTRSPPLVPMILPPMIQRLPSPARAPPPVTSNDFAILRKDFLHRPLAGIAVFLHDFGRVEPTKFGGEGFQL